MLDGTRRMSTLPRAQLPQVAPRAFHLEAGGGGRYVSGMIRCNEQRPMVPTTVQSGFTATDYNSKHAGMMLQRAVRTTFDNVILASICNRLLVF